MSMTVLVLGAKGRFGRAAASAFEAAGADVRRLARSVPDGAEGRWSAVDALNPASLSEAAKGCDIIVNAVNVPYGDWERDVPRLTKSVLTAARTSGACVIVPGNVYPYGDAMPELLSSGTTHDPSNRYGRVRAEMEAAYQADPLVRTILLRGGDFMESVKSGNWFDAHIVPKVPEGIVTYPGPMTVPHAWAYLPDMARAAVELAQIRDRLPPFADIGFEGYTVTGAELVAAIEEVTGRKMRVKQIPWPILRGLSLFSGMMRGVVGMSYLWRVPHQIDGRQMSELLPEFRPTELKAALADSLP